MYITELSLSVYSAFANIDLSLTRLIVIATQGRRTGWPLALLELLEAVK